MKRGRIVVITGAAGGMGALLVERFLANCDAVFATDTSEEALSTLAGKIDEGTQLHTMAADISDEASCARLAAFAGDKAGRVDVLINCAGFFPIQSFEEMTLADWNKVIGINLTGVFLMVKAMLPLMKGRGWGRIVNIGSGSMFVAWRSRPTTSPPRPGCSDSRAAWHAWSARKASPSTSSRPASRLRQPSPSPCRGRWLRRRSRRAPSNATRRVKTWLAPSSSWPHPTPTLCRGQTLNVDGGKHML